MTNYDEGTQDEPVTGKPRPTLGKIITEAVFTAIMAGVLVWLVAGLADDPTGWDWAGVLAYAGLTGWFLFTTAKLIQRYRAPELVPTGYTDRDGDRWDVRPDGRLAYAHGGSVWERDLVEREYGPLTPVTE